MRKIDAAKLAFLGTQSMHTALDGGFGMGVRKALAMDADQYKESPKAAKPVSAASSHRLAAAEAKRERKRAARLKQHERINAHK